MRRGRDGEKEKQSSPILVFKVEKVLGQKSCSQSQNLIIELGMKGEM